CARDDSGFYGTFPLDFW
nr:immunoglobulin heavy chain junction region [Macaca mulatta]MOW49230.1 immunoglobulin heavy chain junction region [Macaca mulatta]